jgi:hypothetical protein
MIDEEYKNYLLLCDSFENVHENEYGFVVNAVLVKSYFLQTNKWIDEIIRELRVYGKK